LWQSDRGAKETRKSDLMSRGTVIASDMLQRTHSPHLAAHGLGSVIRWVIVAVVILALWGAYGLINQYFGHGAALWVSGIVSVSLVFVSFLFPRTGR
jgi:Na+/proline symporter